MSNDRPLGLRRRVHTDTAAAIAHDTVSKLGRAMLDPREFFYEVAARVRSVIPDDASGWMTLDPDTMLLGGALETGKPDEIVRALWRNELLVPDVHKLTVLARQPSPVAALSQLSPAAAAQSERLELIHRPRGIGDEMRVILRAGGSTWGHFALYRELGSRAFDATERAFAAEIAAEIGEGLRRILSRSPNVEVTADLAPGVVVLDGAGQMISATVDASQTMALMPGDATLTLDAIAVAASQSDGARARVRLTDGRWLLLRGGRLHGDPSDSAHVAVTLMPAPRADVTSVLLRLHGLSAREREVAELLMLGLATKAIAERLHISRHTLHDHIKSILAKVGVRSRAELMALGSDHVGIRL